jgi:hypothetical protein
MGECWPRRSGLALGFSWISLALALFTSIAWSQANVSELRKPAPDSQAQPYRERLETLIRARYPELLTQKIAGTPVVTILFDGEGTPERTDLRVVATSPGPLTGSHPGRNVAQVE